MKVRALACFHDEARRLRNVDDEFEVRPEMGEIYVRRNIAAEIKDPPPAPDLRDLSASAVKKSESYRRDTEGAESESTAPAPEPLSEPGDSVVNQSESESHREDAEGTESEPTDIELAVSPPVERAVSPRGGLTKRRPRRPKPPAQEP